MSLTRWARLKKRIRQCKREMNWWSGFAWTLLGVALPSGVSAIQDNRAAWTLSLWTVVTIISVIASGLCFLGYVQANKQESDSLESVLDEMDEIELSFGDDANNIPS